MKFRCLRVGLLLSVVSAVATAQPARSRSLELSLGLGGMTGVAPRTYRSSAGGAFDAMFSAPVGANYRVGVSWSAQAGLNNTDDCIVRDPRRTDSGCLKTMPPVTSWTVLAGRDWHLSPSLSVRAYAGPSLVGVYRKESSPYYWSSMGGVTGRLDLVLPSRINTVLSIRGLFAPGLPESASGAFAFGLGFGVH